MNSFTFMAFKIKIYIIEYYYDFVFDQNYLYI